MHHTTHYGRQDAIQVMATRNNYRNVSFLRKASRQTDRQTHKRAWPQYILRRLRLTQNVTTETCHYWEKRADRHTDRHTNTLTAILCISTRGKVITNFSVNYFQKFSRGASARAPLTGHCSCSMLTDGWINGTVLEKFWIGINSSVSLANKCPPSYRQLLFNHLLFWNNSSSAQVPCKNHCRWMKHGILQAGCRSCHPTDSFAAVRREIQQEQEQQQQQQQQQPFYGPLSGATRMSQYQKKQSPTHHPDHHPVFISFLHLLRSITSSLFKLRAWQSFCTTSLHVLFGPLLVLEPSTSYSIHFFIQFLHLLFATHAHTIATCFAVVSILYHLFLVFHSTPYLELLSFTLTLHIDLTILISARWSATSFSFLTGQVSLPCSILLCTQLINKKGKLCHTPTALWERCSSTFLRSMSPQMHISQSVVHGWRNVRPTVTFPATEHCHCPCPILISDPTKGRRLSWPHQKCKIDTR